MLFRSIAAAIHSRYGTQLTPEQTFVLNSGSAVAAAIENGTPAQKKTELTAQTLPINPELLPLLAPATATEQLARQPVAPNVKSRVCVAATFVAHPLADALKLWSGAFGIEAEVQFADYNQVPQTLLAPDSVFAKNPTATLESMALSDSSLPSTGTRKCSYMCAPRSGIAAHPLWASGGVEP